MTRRDYRAPREIVPQMPSNWITCNPNTTQFAILFLGYHNPNHRAALRHVCMYHLTRDHKGAVQLKRGAGGLLKTLGGQPRGAWDMARGYKIAAPDVVMIEDDVDEEQEVDLLKEPESSVESEDEIKDAPPAAADSGTKISATKLKRPTRRAQAAQEKRTRQQSGRRKRSSSDIKDEDDGPQAETTKVSRRRTNGDVCENEIDDSGPMFPDFDVAMSSQPRPSQRNPVDNLFANRPRERRPGYGRSSQPTRSQGLAANRMRLD